MQAGRAPVIVAGAPSCSRLWMHEGFDQLTVPNGPTRRLAAHGPCDRQGRRAQQNEAATQRGRKNGRSGRPRASGGEDGSAGVSPSRQDVLAWMTRCTLSPGWRPISRPFRAEDRRCHRGRVGHVELHQDITSLARWTDVAGITKGHRTCSCSSLQTHERYLGVR